MLALIQNEFHNRLFSKRNERPFARLVRMANWWNGASGVRGKKCANGSHSGPPLRLTTLHGAGTADVIATIVVINPYIIRSEQSTLPTQSSIPTTCPKMCSFDFAYRGDSKHFTTTSSGVAVPIYSVGHHLVFSLLKLDHN